MSSPPSSAAAPPVPPPPPLADFGDWLSPMIVKELRQGLRTWVFVGAFIVLQAILTMTLLISSTAGNEEASTYLFWMLVAAILVGIVPLRGFNALAGEMKAETLDLLMLTRLGAFRIAAGKWIALVAQGGLIAVSVLPYVVLRYFGGGIDLVGELLALLLLWMLSAAVTAVAVAFSSLPSVILRGFILLGTYVMAIMAVNAIILLATMRLTSSGAFFFGTSSTPDLWLALAVITPLWAYGCYFLLDVGATAVSPLAANHATRKRLISLALILGSLAIAWYLPASADGRGIAVTCVCALSALAAFDCLTEPPATSPSVFKPFVRRGHLGRLAAAFFAPGWATGLCYYALLCVLVLAALRLVDAVDSRQESLILANVLLAPLVPLALGLIFFRNHPRPLGPYIVCTLILGIASLLLFFMAEIGREDSVGYVAMITPPSALALHDTMDGIDEENFVLTGGVATGIGYFLFLLWRVIPVSKAMQQAVAAAKTQVDSP